MFGHRFSSHQKTPVNKFHVNKVQRSCSVTDASAPWQTSITGESRPRRIGPACETSRHRHAALTLH